MRGERPRAHPSEPNQEIGLLVFPQCLRLRRTAALSASSSHCREAMTSSAHLTCAKRLNLSLSLSNFPSEPNLLGPVCGEAFLAKAERVSKLWSNELRSPLLTHDRPPSTRLGLLTGTLQLTISEEISSLMPSS